MVFPFPLHWFLAINHGLSSHVTTTLTRPYQCGWRCPSSSASSSGISCPYLLPAANRIVTSISLFTAGSPSCHDRASGNGPRPIMVCQRLRRRMCRGRRLARGIRSIGLMSGMDMSTCGERVCREVTDELGWRGGVYH